MRRRWRWTRRSGRPPPISVLLPPSLDDWLPAGHLAGWSRSWSMSMLILAQPLPKKPAAAGPRMMMKITGKMKITSGTMIFTGTFCAFSSAT